MSVASFYWLYRFVSLSMCTFKKEKEKKKKKKVWITRWKKKRLSSVDLLLLFNFFRIWTNEHGKPRKDVSNDLRKLSPYEYILIYLAWWKDIYVCWVFEIVRGVLLFSSMGNHIRRLDGIHRWLYLMNMPYTFILELSNVCVH